MTRILSRFGGILLLCLALAGCGQEPPIVYEMPRFAYLPPIRLDVESIEIVQRYIPSGLPPDISNQSPIPPVQGLRIMAEDRLQAFGASGRAVFSILEAPLIRQGDTIDGAMLVMLEIYTQDNVREGFAVARVARRLTGRIDGLRATLYRMVRDMLDEMNVEFEFQVRRNLRERLASNTAVSTPVEEAPLESPPTR